MRAKGWNPSNVHWRIWLACTSTGEKGPKIDHDLFWRLNNVYNIDMLTDIEEMSDARDSWTSAWEVNNLLKNTFEE